MRRSIPLLLLLVAGCGRPSTAAGPGTCAPRLAVHGPGGFVELAAVRTGATTVLAPLACRSERVPRAALARRGVGLRISAGAGSTVLDRPPSVIPLPHRADEQILLVDGRPHVVGPPVLPRRVDGCADLAFLARQDGNVAEGGGVRIEAPEELSAAAVLVLVGGETELESAPWTVRVDGAERALAPGPRAALVVPAAPSTGIELGAALLDQAFFAEARPCEVSSAALAPRTWTDADGHVPAGGTLEVWYEPPQEPAEGETWTLLVALDARVAGGAAGSPWEAAAERAESPLTDVAREVGLRFVHLEGPDEQLDIRPTMGPGAAWGDVDGDGWVDLYLVQGGGREGSDPLPNRLYKNRGDGTFADVTAESGAGDTSAGMGALFFDADGDGDLDLYVANYGRDVLYENDGEGHFTDASERAGLVHELWSAGVCAADHDRDGDLDLYVTSYLDYDLDKMPPAAELGRYRREDPLPMLPFAFPGQRNVFLRNDGGLCFTDVTDELGVADLQGRGMQAVFWDFDADGDQDLYVANDVSPNVLYRNEGDGTFLDVSFATGLDDPRGGMGLEVGDVDLDGDEDLFLTNWQLEANALYLSNRVSPYEAKHRRSSFHDATVRAGLGRAGIGVTSWGAVLLDLENDGDLDLFVANGYTSPDYEGTGICVGQPNHLFVNDGEGGFEALPPDPRELASRSAVGCDYDRDGDVDVLVTANNGRVQLLRNDVERRGRWLGVQLAGTGGNTFGIGAEVAVTAGGVTRRRSLRAGTSYLGGNPPELLFGLGAGVDEAVVEVWWPSGRRTRHAVEELDAWMTVVEGE